MMLNFTGFLSIHIFVISLCIADLSFARSVKKDFSAPHVPNQLIVKFKSQKNSNRTLQRHVLQQFDTQVVHQFHSNGALLIELPPKLVADDTDDLRQLAVQLSSRPDVEYVEPNWILHSTGHSIKSDKAARAVNLMVNRNIAIDNPNDPLFKKQVISEKAHSGADISAQEAWTVTTGSKNVLVAVIDSGVDSTHEDLAENYWHNPGETGLDSQGRDKRTNGIDDDNNGYVDDWRGWNFIENTNNPIDETNHGTHCAGTIGASGNNGKGIAGINWNVSILGLKFIGKNGTGDLANAVKAVEYATDMGVDIMNNSWGGEEQSETMAAAIRRANKAGILFVVAAGNDANDIDLALDYPAAYDIENIISVAAVDDDGQLASFSNHGLDQVHIAAPGMQILSTIAGNGYDREDGTSMAAPFVAGAAALIKARFPQLKAREIKGRLLGGAIPTPALQGQVASGLLNIYNSLKDDLVPPEVPAEIFLRASGAANLALEWPLSQDKDTNQKAYSYELRRSEKPMLNESDWAAASLVKFKVLSETTTKIKVRADISPFDTVGYVALRAIDHSGNYSVISKNLAYSLRKTSVAYSNKGDTLEGLSIHGRWGLEITSNRGTVISDSPNQNYDYGTTTSLELPILNISTRDMVLSFKAKYDFEVGYDFGFLEISKDDGNTWTEIAKFTGSRPWRDYTFPLGDFLASDDQSLKLRFRTTSDATTSQDGWYLSDISVLN